MQHTYVCTVLCIQVYMCVYMCMYVRIALHIAVMNSQVQSYSIQCVNKRVNFSSSLENSWPAI